MRLFTVIALVISTFIASPIFAEILAQNGSVYTDEKTGITLVFAEVELKGLYHIDTPEALTAVSQFAILEVGMTDVDTPEDFERFQINPPLPSNTKWRYRFAGILRDPNANEVLFTLKKSDGDLVENVRLDLKTAKINTTTVNDFHRWAKKRHKNWQRLANPNIPNLIYDIWAIKSESIYGTKIPNTLRFNNRRNDEVSSLSIFGGQTAIRETLQTQLIENSDKNASNDKLIDITTIKGVEVKAHPYAQMLEALTADAKKDVDTQSALANYVPDDRLMILVREPKAIAELLRADNDLFSRLAPMLGNGFADYALLERYTARFGLTPEQLRAWFSGKNVAEIALFAPDVFFLDNTDLTAVIRLKPSASIPFKMAKNITDILPITLPEGETFYLASRDDLLFISSRKTEIEKSLLLADNKGKGSLGTSDEFKVMGHQLPMKATSHVYLYFSDPFIRRLTSPEIKIGQLRRAMARQTIETITAMALLYRLDHGVDADLATLKARGYLTESEAPSHEYTLETDLRAVSKTWGSLAQLTPLTANPITQITQSEADNYIAYRERYSSFWQQFFDPIAVRTDITEKGGFTLETFILPLIDNSIYNALKEIVGAERPEKTEVPIYSQTPIANMAFNIPKDRAPELLRGFYGLRLALMPLLPFIGNTAVLSIQDSDPVVQSNFPGLGAFNSQNNFFGVRGSDLLIVPVIGALFTRPVDLAIQITDEEKLREALRNLYLGNDQFSNLEKTYRESENQLIFDWTVLGVIRMEFSLTIEDGWLHISNHPWTPISIVNTQILEPNHAAVQLRPSMLKKALPQILSLAQSAYRQSVYSAAAELLPWMRAYNIDQETAFAIQKKALGLGTPLPTEVSLTTNPVNAKPYGNWMRQEMPASTEHDSEFIKLFQNLDLWLRFEEEGLRSRLEFIP